MDIKGEGFHMSTFKYWESELEGLKDASARLERDYQTQSEAVKIDLRRRYDQAIAVAFRAKSIWAGAEVQKFRSWGWMRRGPAQGRTFFSFPPSLP